MAKSAVKKKAKQVRRPAKPAKKAGTQRATAKKPASKKAAAKKPAPKKAAAKKKRVVRPAKKRPTAPKRAAKPAKTVARKPAARKPAAPKRAAAKRPAAPKKAARPAAKSAKPQAKAAKPAVQTAVKPPQPQAAAPVRVAPKRSASRPAPLQRFAPPTPTPTPPAVKSTGPKPLRIRARPAAAASPVSAPAGPPIDLALVRARLQAKKQEILALYLNDLRSGQESNDSPTEDIVDRANNAYSRELNFSISDTERALMLQVDEAIRRVEAGTYANCANCGNPIARLRLEAVPWARYCISCQELLEQGMLSEG